MGRCPTLDLTGRLIQEGRNVTPVTPAGVSSGGLGQFGPMQT